MISHSVAAQSNSCDFIVTKAICLEDGMKEICVEALDPQGLHEWDITPSNGSCTQTHLSGQKVCFQCNWTGSGYVQIGHTVYPLEGLPLSCARNIFISCNPSCGSWNFTSLTNPDCSTILNINPNFLIADPITWVFGDGSSAVQTPGNVKTISHQYSTPGTYTVCVTLSFDESAYQTCCFTIFVPPCPECEPDPISWEVCPPSGENCCIKLTFNSPFDSPEFVWDFGDQSPPVTTLTKTVEHSFIGRGPYYICVNYFIEDIPFTCCEWIDLPPCDCCESADFSFYGLTHTNYQSCMGLAYRTIPVCDRPGMTVHKWIYSDGTIIYTGTPGGSPPDHVFTNYVNSTGEVCVTHQVLCDNIVIDEVTKCLPFYRGAYLGQAGQNLNMSDILTNQGNITVFDFITQYANNPTIPLYIEGDLTVDINSNFTGGTWNMAFGSQIFVNVLRTFGLNQTTIQTALRVNPNFSCCRWEGITAYQATTLNWSGTTISDANTMLKLLNTATSNGSLLNFSDNQFIENINGIYSFRHRPRFGNFHNNVFQGCANCSILCGCDVGTGIYINLNGITSLPVTFPVTGSKNNISDFEIGIHGINLNLVTKNFNIFGIDVTGLLYEKNVSRPFDHTLDLVNFNTIPTAVKEIISGGGSHKLNATASAPLSSITMANIYKGYDIEVSQTKLNGFINSNQIATNGGTENFGIQVDVTESIDNQFTASYNNITAGGGGTSCMGISLLSDVDNNQNATVKFNQITAAGLDPGAGIFISNWKKSKITDNTVTIGITKPGIEFSNAGTSLIQCNYLNYGSKGMLYNISPENDIVNNTCNANVNGTHFFGNCQGTAGAFIGENKFQSNSLEGTLYNSNAITGIQHHDKYNSWLPVVAGVKARHLSSINASNCVVKAPSNASAPSIHFPHRQPLILFDPSGPTPGLVQACSIGSGGEAYSQYHSSSNSAGQSYNDLLGQVGLFDNMELPLVNSMKQSIYELLLLWPGWLNDYANLATFYNANQNNFIGQSSNLRKELKDFQQTLENQVVALNQYYDQYENLAAQLLTLDAQLQTETDPNVIASLLIQIAALEQQIEALVQTISAQILANQQSNAVSIAAFQASNNSLVANTLDEVNEKKLNDILLKIWREEALSASDETDIRTIAQYCYAYGGRAVFDARNLCMKLFGEYYAIEDCSNGFGGVQSRAKSVNNLSISPNPVREELIISIYGDFVLPENVQVLNSLGQVIDLKVKTLSRQSAMLDASNLKNGVYYLLIELDGQRQTVKFVVSH